MSWTRQSPFALIATAVLTACTNMLPPDSRMRLNTSRTTFELCDALAVGRLAPVAVRAEWKLELDRRGANCSSYLQERNEQDAKDSAALRRLLSDVGRAAAAAQRREDIDLVGGTSNVRRVGTSCLKKGEALRSTSRHCIYDCLGSEVVQTISSVDICPLFISR